MLSNFVNHLYDYTLNWTLFSLIPNMINVLSISETFSSFFHLVAPFYVMWLFFRKFCLLELVMIFLPICTLFHQKAVKIFLESTGIMQFTVKEH